MPTTTNNYKNKKDNNQVMTKERKGESCVWDCVLGMDRKKKGMCCLCVCMCPIRIRLQSQSNLAVPEEGWHCLLMMKWKAINTIEIDVTFCPSCCGPVFCPSFPFSHPICEISILSPWNCFELESHPELNWSGEMGEWQRDQALHEPSAGSDLKAELWMMAQSTPCLSLGMKAEVMEVMGVMVCGKLQPFRFSAAQKADWRGKQLAMKSIQRYYWLAVAR